MPPSKTEGSEKKKKKKKAPSSTCPASPSGTTTAAPADDVRNPAAGHGDVATVVVPSAYLSAAPLGKGGINGGEPRKKKKKRSGRKGRNKRGSGSPPPSSSSSTGTQANEDSEAVACGAGTPSSSPPPRRVPSPSSSSPSPSSSGSRGNPVKDNSAAGSAAAAAGSSSSSAATNGDPSAAQSSPKKKTGWKGGGVTSASSSTAVPKTKTAVMGGTVPLTHHAEADADTASASSSSGDSKFGGGTEAMVVQNKLHQYLPLSIDYQLQLQFYKFLNEYTNPEEQYPFYKAHVVSLSRRKCCTLEVNFEHLKSSFFKNTTEYWDLVFKIVNNPDRSQSWLQRVISLFLMSEGFDGDEKTIGRNAKVHFINKPQSIAMLNDALKDRSAVVRKLSVLREVILNAPTTYGRSIFLAILSELLNRHRKGHSYDGKFELGDIVIVNSKLCWILIEPSPMKSVRANVKSDLKKLWTITNEYYISEGYPPLYFEELRRDLEEDDEQLFNARIKEPFRLYLEYHPALMASRGRHEMIIGLNSVIQDHRSLMDKVFTSFLEEAPFKPKDWTDKIKKGQSDIMKRVYTFGTIGLKRDPLAKTGFSEDYFANTWEGLLGYIRNFLMHANKTAKIIDTDEIELFAASKFPTLLPRLLKEVSSNCKIQPYFTGVISSYRISRSNPKDLPSSN